MSAGTCPVMHDFDPLGEEYLRDPYSQLAVAQREHPIFFSPVLDAYIVTRFADVEQVFADTESFSSSNTVSPIWPVTPDAAAVLATAFERVPTLTNADGARHDSMRRFVQRALSPRRYKSLRPRLEAQAGELIDALRSRPVADFYAEVAYPLPAMTGFGLLGFPEQDTELLKSWVSDRQQMTWGKTEPEDQVRIAQNIVAFSDYIEKFIQTRLESPQDDAVSDLLAMHLEKPDELTLLDIANIVFLLSAGAHESTTSLMTHCVRRLLENPAEWERLKADPTLIPKAVEEALRYDASSLMWPRKTRVDVELGDVTIPAGSAVLLALGGANRDEATFPEAQKFDVGRPDSRRHLSFGRTTHFCLGAPLARMEMEVVLQLLVTKVPNMSLVVGQAFPYQKNVVMRSPQGLLVEPGAPIEVSSPTAGGSASAEKGEDAVTTSSPLVAIDPDKCIAAGACMDAAPNAFALSDEGQSVVLPGAAGMTREELVRIASLCPNGAIAVLAAKGAP
jgi:cytochrome P450/ferredoxin